MSYYSIDWHKFVNQSVLAGEIFGRSRHTHASQDIVDLNNQTSVQSAYEIGIRRTKPHTHNYPDFVGDRLSLNGDVIISRASAGVLSLSTGTQFNIANTAGLFSINSDTILTRDAANTLALRNGTNAQTFNIYNTFTSATNYERCTMAWSGNQFYIQNQKGSAGGTARVFQFGVDGNNWKIDILGDLIPGADATQDLGAPTLRARTGYFGGANASQALILKLGASQTANALEVQDSSGNVLARFGPTGRLFVQPAFGTTTYLFQETTATFTLANLLFSNNYGILHKTAGGVSKDTYYVDPSDNVVFGATAGGWNSIQFRNGSATPAQLYLTSTGRLGIANNTPSALLHVKGTSDLIQSIVQANATQTANLQEWQNSSGTALSRIDKDGQSTDWVLVGQIFGP